MTKIKGPEIGYIDLLDSALISDYEKDSEIRKYYPLRPSSAGKCTRELGYELEEYVKKLPITEKREPNVIRLLSVGHSIEYSAINHLKVLRKHFGFNVRYQQQTVTIFKLDDGRIIEGSLDLCLVSDKYKCIADIKSTKDAFSRFHSTRIDEQMAKYKEMDSIKALSDKCFYAEDTKAFVAELKDDFKINNILQLNSYANSPFIKERGFDHCSLFYYVKNDSKMFEIRFNPCEDLAEEVKQKYNDVYKTVEVNKESPDTLKKDFKLGSIRCAFCNYKDKCWNEDALKEYFKKFPDKDWPTKWDKVKNKRELDKMFKEYEANLDSIDNNKEIEALICEELNKQKIRKIKLKNDKIYEVRYLKTPRPHFALRRSK
ncbi:MAG: hypothetical protein GTN36_02710 [Candidatus Aenigmarchaeota archaeon]|nr:hypothetical protein [Candidatus Aenigmarchaeota archaeon]